MRRQIQKNVALIIVMTFVSSVSFAGRGWAKGDREKSRDMIFEQLKLSPDQKSQLKDIKNKTKDEMKALREKKRSLFKQMRAAFKNNENDEKLRSLHNEMQGVRAKLSGLRFESMLQIRGVLNEDQRRQFQELRPMRENKKDR